jgi:hypothetical protein
MLAILVVIVIVLILFCLVFWYIGWRNTFRNWKEQFQRDREQLWSKAIDPPTVFVSYRRRDSRSIAFRFAARLHDFHNLDVFIDESRIKGGQPLWPAIQAPLRRADVVFFVIDREWETARREPSREPALFEPGDWVRREILLTLANGTPAVAVLVDNRPVPTNVPDNIRPLFVNAGLPLDSGANFNHNTAELALVAMSSQGVGTMQRRKEALDRDVKSMSEWIRRTSQLIWGCVFLSVFSLVFLATLCVSLWQNARSETALSGKLTEQTRDLSLMEGTNKTLSKAVDYVSQESKEAYTISLANRDDVKHQKSGIPYSLGQMASAEKRYGGKDAVFANWNEPRRVLVEAYAREWKPDQLQLTLFPAKDDDDNSAELILDLNLPSNAPLSMRSMCSSCAKAKSKVRVLALTRARSVKRITGTLELILPLD